MTPKELFLKSNDAKIVANVLAGLPFQSATEAALLEYQGIICNGSNEVTSAAANHFRLEGARAFAAILKQIAIPAEFKAKEPIGQLKIV